MRGLGGALAVLLAGCLSAPPGAAPADAAGDDDGGDRRDAAAADGPGATPCADLPPLAGFEDDFTDDALAWAVEPKPGRSGGGEIEMAVVDDELLFTPGALGNDHAWLQTPLFDFTSGRVVARVTRLTTEPGIRPYLGIIGPAGEARIIGFDGARLEAPDGREVLYLPEVHVWWQVVSEEGIMRFQTSADGVSWEELEAGDPGFALDAVQFEVGIDVDVAGASDGVFAIDDLNRPPCGA